MNYRTLGRTGLSVSSMGLGCGGHSRLGMSQQKGEDNAVRVVRRALDLGINFIDTADLFPR
jgi:aryl-alcohol dehydrogenase-like predicted oxidoreductase